MFLEWDKHIHLFIYQLQYEISNNVVYATSKASHQPAHTHSLIRDFASGLNFFMKVKLLNEHHLEFLSKKRMQSLV